MSKARSLRELMRHFPESAERVQIALKLSSQDDRSAALLSSALMEGLLEKLIIKKLSLVNPELERRIFDNRGPLSDFYSKILIANAMGIIPDVAAMLIGSIRTVRNVFGHSLADVTFQNPDIRTEIERYIRPFVTRVINSLRDDDDEVIEKQVQSRIDAFKNDSKGAFCTATLFLAFILDPENPITDDLSEFFHCRLCSEKSQRRQVKATLRWSAEMLGARYAFPLPRNAIGG